MKNNIETKFVEMTSTNTKENFEIHFIRKSDGVNNFFIYEVTIKDLNTDEFKTEEFYDYEAALDVYTSFINWSLKGMHTFEQRKIILESFKQYYTKKC